MSDPIKHLRELLAKATPGTWHENRGRIVGGPDDQPNDAEVVAACYGLSATRNGNAALIVAAVNALPALLDALEAFQDVAEQANGQWSDDYLWEKWRLNEQMEKGRAALAKLEASHG